jgi:glycerophosphoryl diester phosphodiesterase
MPPPRHRAPIARKLCFLALLMLVLLGLLLASMRPAAQQACLAALPRVISHRGFDVDDGAQRTASAATVEALLQSGVHAFDLDVFWAADDARGQLFVGHPSHLRALWSLPQALVETRLYELRSRAGAPLLELGTLLELVRRRASDVAQLSLELKEPANAAWFSRLVGLYTQLAAADVADVATIVVESNAHAALHRRAQETVGTRVALHKLLRDTDAPRDAGGRSRANLSALAAARALGFDGYSVSARLLEPALVAAVQPAALSVWTVDDEPTLRTAFDLGIGAVISNRPRWALRTLAKWHRKACGGRTAAQQVRTAVRAG